MRVRVASFNIRNGLAWDGGDSWPFRKGATVAAVRDLDADVVGLQEAYGFQAKRIDRGLDGYGLTGDGRSVKRRGERCAVVWREARLDLVGSETRWYGHDHTVAGLKLPDASFPRVATFCRFQEAGAGPSFTFVNTHLDEHHERNRVTAAEQLLGWLDGGPTIVVGDLNAEPDSRVVAALLGGLTDAVPDPPLGTNHDFTGRTDGRRIDFVLVSPHWTVESSRVVTDRPGGRYPSDHWPVVADLTLAAP